MDSSKSPIETLDLYEGTIGTFFGAAARCIFEEREAMASKVNALKTSEDNETSTGGTAESENTDVFEKIRRLFGDDIYDSLQSKS